MSGMRILAALWFGLAAAFACTPSPAAEGKIAVVAAENFYGDIAKQIGGDRVEVVSILSNPDQDPHLFETTPGIVRQIADAKIVIVNGANYDPWMDKLLTAAPKPNRIVINAAQITGAKAGANPHLWYAPATMPAVATAIAKAFAAADEANASDYALRLSAALASMQRVSLRVAQMKSKYSGTVVTATEPVFGPLAEALGFTVRNERLALAVMNDTEPSARDIAAFEDDLKQRKVKLMLYNKQVSAKLTERLRGIAAKAKVPAVGVTETQPAGMTFQDWMLGQLDAVDKALTGPNS